MFKVVTDGHCFLKGLVAAGSVIATGELTASHLNIDGGLLQIDTSGATSAIFAVGRALELDGDGLVANFAGSVTLSALSGGDLTLNADDDIILGAAGIRVGLSTGTTIGFYGSSGAAKQTISGSRDGNGALLDLLQSLENLGLIVDDTAA